MMFSISPYSHSNLSLSEVLDLISSGIGSSIKKIWKSLNYVCQCV